MSQLSAGLLRKTTKYLSLLTTHFMPFLGRNYLMKLSYKLFTAALSILFNPSV